MLLQHAQTFDTSEKAHREIIISFQIGRKIKQRRKFLDLVEKYMKFQIGRCILSYMYETILKYKIGRSFFSNNLIGLSL